MSPRDAMEVFARARVVITVLGAAEVNLLFCGPGTHVIEYEIKSWPVYAHMASETVLNLTMWAMPTTFDDAYRQDVVVDIPELMGVVEAAMADLNGADAVHS